MRCVGHAKRLGAPLVLEATHSGCKLRPYDQRVLHSHSHSIEVRPLKVGVNALALNSSFSTITNDARCLVVSNSLLY